MSREEETRQNIEKYHDEYLVNTQESMILGEIAISLAMIADVLKGKERMNDSKDRNI